MKCDKVDFKNNINTILPVEQTNRTYIFWIIYFQYFYTTDTRYSFVLTDILTHFIANYLF